MKLIFSVFLSLLSCSLMADTGIDAYREGKFKEAAKQIFQNPDKNEYSYYYLGEMLLYGYGLEKNDTYAVQAYQNAAHQGFLPAIQLLAQYHLLIKKNPKQALYWFELAAKQKDVAAMMYCAAAYQYGYGCKASSNISQKYFIEAAKAGQAQAQFFLAQYFLDDKKGNDKKLGMVWLKKAIKQSEPDALVYQAKQYYQAKEVDKALAMIESLMEKKYPQAWTFKAQYLLENHHWVEGHQYLLKAAQRDYPFAQFLLGQFYFQKDTPFYQPEYGFLWLLQALKNQWPEAKIALQKMRLSVIQQQQLEKTIQQAQNPQSIYSRLSFYLTHYQAKTLEHSVYRIKGIWRDWKNQKALKEQHFNAYPHFFQLSKKELFKSNLELLMPSQISIEDYIEAFNLLKGPLTRYQGVYPNYTNALQKDFNAHEMHILQRQANLGVASAQFQLGACYEFAWGVKKDLTQARRWYQKALAQDDVRAEYSLALLELTQGGEQGISLGKYYLRKAAFKGDVYAQITLGLLNEIPGSKQLKEAKNMYRLAAAQGNGFAMYRLAEWLSRRPIVDKKQVRTQQVRQLYRGAFKAGVQEAALPLAFYEASSSNPKNQAWAMKTALSYANRGNAEAAILLGLMIEKNPKGRQYLAKQWFKKAQNHPIGAFAWSYYEHDALKKQYFLDQAAKVNFPYAYINLAALNILQQQSPVEDLIKAAQLKNTVAMHALINLWVCASDKSLHVQAREMLATLAAQGDIEAKWKYAYLLAEGIGGEKQGAQSLEWMQQAANHSAMAQFVLAYFYHMGKFDGLPNEEKAQYWFKQAEKQIPKASVALGYLYEIDDKDYLQALKAYQKVRDKEPVLANYNIALMYEYGKGIEPNFLMAKRYWLAAAEGGSIAAMFKLAAYYQQQGYSMTAHAYLEKALSSKDHQPSLH